jgi:hypothetical protein
MSKRDGYRWKAFRGPRDQRQPYSGHWYSEVEPGLTQSRGFGPLEAVDLCQSLVRPGG